MTSSTTDPLDIARRVIGIEAQALVLLAASLDDRFTKAVDLILAAKGRVIVSGMGKSGHIARKRAATFASTGTPAQFVHPAEASHGDLGMMLQGDVVLVLSPLLLSAMLTLLIAILVPLPLNFANIIALPLLLGVGVSFNVYTVMNWRDGMTNPLATATTKAIVYSALTTAMAFGSVALSAHPGTASFGVLLILSLTCSLIASLVFLPALLVCVGRPRP